MTTVISITIEGFSLVISMLIALFMSFQKRKTKFDNAIQCVIFLSVFLLVSDILAYSFGGNLSTAGWYIVRVSNFLVFLINYLFFIGYGVCLRLVIKTDSRAQRILFDIVSLLTVASIALLIVSQFNGCLYYFDSNNCYHRGDYFFLSQAAPIIGGLIYYIMLMANRKIAQHNILFFLGFYLFIPYIASFFQLFVYGYPVQTVLVVVSCWGIYFVREVQVRNQLSMALEESNNKQEQLRSAFDTINNQFTVLHSMSDIFYSMYLIDLSNDTFIEYRSKDELRKSIKDVNGMASMMKKVITEFTTDEYRDGALKFTDLTTVADRMKNKKRISEEFVGKQLGWYRAQFISIETKPSGIPTRLVFTVQNIDEEKRQRELLIHRSLTDKLSGFLNRWAYEQDTSDESLYMSDDFIYISFDVNGLKTVNDTCGHNAGDEMLLGAVSCMREAFSNYGRLYRIGGDEFIALLFLDEKQLESCIEEFNRRVKSWSGNLVKSISVSYGYVRRSELPEASIEKMAELSDQKMYSMKRAYYDNMSIF